MGDLKTLFDALYERFLLRDLFGKTVPGLILLFFASTAYSNVNATLTLLKDLSFFGGLIAIGVGWIAGFALQALGEWRRLILYYPKESSAVRSPSSWIAQSLLDGMSGERFNLDEYMEKLSKSKNDSELILKEYVFGDDKDWYQFVNLFEVAIGDNVTAKQARERMVVIKEACGNTYLSLLSSLLFVFFIWTTLPWEGCLILTILVISGMILLCRMHFIHVQREYRIMQGWIRDAASKAGQAPRNKKTVVAKKK